MGATATIDLDLSAPPADLEYKSAGSGVLLNHDDEKGIVEALVSVTGIKDEQGDVIVPGAYAETLAKRKSKGVRHHDWTRMAAKTLVQEEWLPGDSRLPATLPNGDPWPPEAGALYIKGQYNLETKDGQEGYSNAKFFGDEGQWSIGYKPVSGHVTRRKGDGARVLAKLDLYEWSDVLHGAAPQTSTLTVKSANTDAGGFGDVLDDAEDDEFGAKFDPSQPRAADGEWTAGGGSGRSAPAGPGPGGQQLGPNWLRRVLAGDSGLVERRRGGRSGGGDAAKRARNAEMARRDKVQAAFDKERAAERKRRDAADRAIEQASGDDKTKLQAAERERRRKWQEAFASAQDAEKERRRKWAAQQREGSKMADPDLDGDLDLGIEDDPLDDEDDEDDAGEAGQKGVDVNVETKVRDVLPGSYEERREALRDACRRALAGPTDQNGNPEWWVYVVGTWDDHVVVNRSPRGDGASQTWQIPYTIGADGTISLGEMVRVELVAQVVPATSAKSLEVPDATVDSVTDLLEDAAAQLSMALVADAGGVKGLHVGSGGADRLAAAAVQLLGTLDTAGVDVYGDDLDLGEKSGEGEAEETKNGDHGGGMVLSMKDIQASLDELRAV